jgi:ankyrin repeat protein
MGLMCIRDFARDWKTLDWLLDQGVDINKTDSQRLDDGFHLAMGESDYSLHLLNRVAADGNIDLFDHLVGRGADASLSTALHSASACKDPDLSKAMRCHFLDKHGMDIDSNNEDFRDFFHDPDDKGSPLCNAIFNRNFAVLHELLKRGASPTYPDEYPISYAVKEDGFLPALEPLLCAGVDPNIALETAVIHQNIEAVKICMACGADLAHGLP